MLTEHHKHQWVWGTLTLLILYYAIRILQTSYVPKYDCEVLLNLHIFTGDFPEDEIKIKQLESLLCPS